ncbi:STAS domain-containing protein [Streptomyces sp. NPDC047014]|uniref:STAS domain-containing protein n=1 Tax=Streptomyces sp. NPDC047014 TaxID=3155736 RepID=UPI0033FF0104
MVGALVAGGWGLFAGAALLVGADIGLFVQVPARWIALVLAFGSGVLLSAGSFELIAEAYERSRMEPVVLGAVGGAVVYSGVNALLARRGAQHRKRSGQQQPSEVQAPGSSNAIALGSLLDGVPESVVIGTSLLGGGHLRVVTVGAVFISNLPESLASAAGMRSAGRSRRYVLTLWSGIALISGLAALAGYALLGNASEPVIAMITAVAGGAILAMIADTVIPEAPADGAGHRRRVPVRGRADPPVKPARACRPQHGPGGSRAASARRVPACGRARTGWGPHGTDDFCRQVPHTLITLGIQRNGATVLAHMSGHLTDEAGIQLHQALDHLTGDDRDLMVDVHAVQAMDADGLLHLVDLHRRAEQRGLRVLVVGWQAQHQQLMDHIAGIPGRGPATGERFALAGFRRLIEQRTRQVRDATDFGSAWLPQP